MYDVKFLKRLVAANGLLPLALLSWDAARGNLGANGTSAAIHTTGMLALVFLFLSLAITPAKYLTGWNLLVTQRRMLGLLSAFYALLHAGIYVVFDREGNLSSTFAELTSRRYLQVGGVALLLMIPLALTSTSGMIKRLGNRRWKALHKLAYVISVLAVIHFYMQVKSDVRMPLAFAVVLVPLLASRLFLGPARKPAQRVPASKGGTPALKPHAVSASGPAASPADDEATPATHAPTPPVL